MGPSLPYPAPNLAAGQDKVSSVAWWRSERAKRMAALDAYLAANKKEFNDPRYTATRLSVQTREGPENGSSTRRVE
jgi:hypothetical protein